MCARPLSPCRTCIRNCCLWSHRPCSTSSWRHRTSMCPPYLPSVSDCIYPIASRGSSTLCPNFLSFLKCGQETSVQGGPSPGGPGLGWLWFGMFHHYARPLCHFCQFSISPVRTRQRAGQLNSKSTQHRFARRWSLEETWWQVSCLPNLLHLHCPFHD